MKGEDNSDNMHAEVDWLKPSDRPILHEISKYDGWHTPKNVSINTPYTNNWTGQRCRMMANHGLLEKHPDQPGYRITDLGRAFLAGELQPDDLRDD